MAITWDEYFMGVAKLSAERSKDPSTRVGACIINQDNRIVGVGYNGTPTGWDDKEFEWGRDGDWLETKYPYVIHAELNAILNATQNLKGCTMYVTMHSCNECAKAIAQSGIKKVIYDDDKYYDSETCVAARKIFDRLGIENVKFLSK
jgi:dCMP deaminase